MRVLVPLTLAAIVAGVVVALTMHTLLGSLLIIGGVGALGVGVLPAVIDRVVVWLSTGTLRRRL